MSTRSFPDRDGRTWMVWNVLPYSADRRQAIRRALHEGFDGERDGVEPRSGQERRTDPTRADDPDRRSGLERRQEPGRRGELDRRSGADRRESPRSRATLPGVYSGGWLCFESRGEKRRLAPVPHGWQDADDTALGDWLAQAAPAQAPRVVARHTPGSTSTTG